MMLILARVWAALLFSAPVNWLVSKRDRLIDRELADVFGPGAADRS